jgi:S-DNA-T family DNA segregation ATPase FtsK/SpoIIIE
MRREIGALVLLLLAVFAFLAMSGVDAVVINLLRGGTGALIGRGLVFLPFTLLAGSGLLLFHRGRPVAHRVTAVLLLPLLIGAFSHAVTYREEYASGWAFFGQLIAEGTARESGGLLAGTLGFLLVSGLSRVGAGIVLSVLIAALLLIAFQTSVVKLIDGIRAWLRDRERYEPEPLPEPIEDAPAGDDRLERKTLSKTSLRDTARQAKRSDVDVPLYLTDEQKEDKPPLDVELKGRKVKTPAEVLMETPAPIPLPQVFAFDDKITYISPETGEVVDGPENGAIAFDVPQKSAGQNGEPDAWFPSNDAPPSPEPRPADETGTAASPRSAPPPPPTLNSQLSTLNSYVSPPLELLSPPKPIRETEINEDLRRGAARLVEVLNSFGLGTQIINIPRGPSVTRYELELESGQKLNKLTALSTDIALAMGAESVNISPIAGKMSVVGVEVPNRVTSMVTLREVMESPAFQNAQSPTVFAVGRDIGGRDIVADIARMPHLLVAGSTGAGKSVCVNALIVSLLYKASPDDLKLILIDPKKVEFPPYNGVPHLLVPVITDAAKAAGTLEWAVLEMEKRYATLADCGKRDIDGYNAAFRDDPEHPRMNRIVIIVDEMADLLMESKKEKNMENFIVRIAQKARACGIHLVLATQRPDAKVITGLIKANVPSRIALKVAGAINSRIVLDRPGAEKLIGHGDMLFAPAGSGNPARMQGCYVDERDIHKVVAHIRKSAEAVYAEDVMEQIDKNQMRAEGVPVAGGAEPEEEHDVMLPAAIEVILDSGQGSVSFLQRRLKLGYARAARLMDLMEQRGIVGPFEGSKPRKVLITREQWEAMTGEG